MHRPLCIIGVLAVSIETAEPTKAFAAAAVEAAEPTCPEVRQRGGPQAVLLPGEGKGEAKVPVPDRVLRLLVTPAE